MNLEQLPHLPREFYNQECETVAKALLGKIIVHKLGSQIKAARVVETEAYLGPHDKAAHSSKGRTARTEVLFGSAGHVYMYLIYGLHQMLNITTRDEGAAVLIRAVEPVAGINDNTKGPGLVTKALELKREHYGLDLTASNELYVVDDGYTPETITTAVRIGVDYAQEWRDKQLRFFIAGNKFVSKLA